jgi:hypothetical protein
MLKHKLIGLYELITGFFGFLLILLNAGKAIEISDIRITIFIGLVFYAGTAYAGYALFNNYRNAVKYSIWLQALWSMSFVFKGGQYLFTGGAFVSVAINNMGAHFHFQVSPIAYSITQVSSSLLPEFKIYIVPVAILILLLIKRKT